MILPPFRVMGTRIRVVEPVPDLDLHKNFALGCLGQHRVKTLPVFRIPLSKIVFTVVELQERIDLKPGILAVTHRVADHVSAGGHDSIKLRDQFVRVDDFGGITKWRSRFNNRDIFSSICIYAESNYEAESIAPIFFDIDSADSVPATRESAITLCEMLMDRR